jgi:hypothetical protein
MVSALSPTNSFLPPATSLTANGQALAANGGVVDPSKGVITEANQFSAQIETATKQLEADKATAEAQKQQQQQIAALQAYNNKLTQQIAEAQAKTTPRQLGATPYVPTGYSYPQPTASYTPAPSSQQLQQLAQILAQQQQATKAVSAPSPPAEAPKTAEKAKAEPKTSAREKIEAVADSMVGYSNKTSPKETEGGRLACAWFVNEVCKKALNRTFPSEGDTLTVVTTVKAMMEAGGKEVSAKEAKKGDIVWVDMGGKRQHIGIVMADGATKLLHNSGPDGKSIITEGDEFPKYKGGKHKFIRLGDVA